MATETRNIEWIEDKFDDRLMLRTEDRVIHRADFHAVIQGVVFGIVRKRDGYSWSWFETYRVDKDGIARKAASDGGFYKHYSMNGREVLLRPCNGTDGLRGRPCTFCKTKREQGQ